MIFRQYLHINPAIAASYLLGCGGRSSGAVIDPLGEVDMYLEDAERLGMKILYVIDTHLHADHISSARELVKRTGATYVLHESAASHYDFYHAVDGDMLELGNVTLTIWHTPGHTPEHLSLLVTDRTRTLEPWMILTGHTLMVGDLGRTELASSAEIGARALFQSVNRLKPCPIISRFILAHSVAAYVVVACRANLRAPSDLNVGLTAPFNSRIKTCLYSGCSRIFQCLLKILNGFGRLIWDSSKR